MEIRLATGHMSHHGLEMDLLASKLPLPICLFRVLRVTDYKSDIIWCSRNEIASHVRVHSQVSVDLKLNALGRLWCILHWRG